MATHLKATIIFDAGKEVGESDMDALIEGIIATLQREFPDHSGSCICVNPVDENGDPIK